MRATRRRSRSNSRSRSRSRVRSIFPRTVKASKGAVKKTTAFFKRAGKALKRIPSWLNRTTSKVVRKVTSRRV